MDDFEPIPSSDYQPKKRKSTSALAGAAVMKSFSKALEPDDVAFDPIPLGKKKHKKEYSDDDSVTRSKKKKKKKSKKERKSNNDEDDYENKKKRRARRAKPTGEGMFDPLYTNNIGKVIGGMGDNDAQDNSYANEEAMEDEADEDVPMVNEIEYEPVSFNDHTKSIRQDYDPSCFGCLYKFGKPRDLNAKGAPKMAKLYHTYASNIGRMSNEELYKLIAKDQFVNYIKPYEKVKKKDKMPPIWTPEKVKAHIEEHGVMMEFELHHQYFALKGFETFMRDHVIKKNITTGNKEPDIDKAMCWFKSLDKAQNTWKMIEGLKHQKVLVD